jgi:hypothetical protein
VYLVIRWCALYTVNVQDDFQGKSKFCLEFDDLSFTLLQVSMADHGHRISASDCSTGENFLSHGLPVLY